MEFKRFYFEGNLRWGYMNNPEDVRELLKDYTYEELRKARRLRNSADAEIPSFGFYREYDDNYTLGDWIDENHLEEFFI
jgi:hypothetical protein